MNKLIIAVVLGVLFLTTVLAVTGFAIAKQDAPSSTETQKTGCGSCSGSCTKTSNCGLATCSAATTGVCGCSQK